MKTIFQLPEAFEDDARLFREQIERLRHGELSVAQFKSFRVPMGVYEQRESDTYMLRVRLPAGGVLPHQMRILAAVARKYGNGLPHVTTRQDVQLHRVLLDDIPTAFEELYAAGLSTRGGGGNTVRNITACCDAGVCPDEVFDPSPWAVALSEFMLPDPLSYQLPRKYKIGFAGCSRDCSGATVQDLGLIARRRNGAPGFAVHLGGGLGGSSRVADPFQEFVPAGEVHLLAEAVKRVFDKHGNRKNRNKARLRFLVGRIGVEGFRELYRAERAELESILPAELPVREIPARERPVPAAGAPPVAGFVQWRAANVSPQRQEGYWQVRLPLPLGDIGSGTLEKLADVVAQYGEGMIRTTQEQNLVMRWVHENELATVHSCLAELGLAAPDAPILRNLVSCMGASTCKLGICLSRGLAEATRKALETNGGDLAGLGDLRIHISGCPNCCGRHPVADIGLHGAARRVKGRLVPHYKLQLGGRVAEGETRLAQGKQTLPGRNLPAALVDLLSAFRASPRFPDFEAFLQEESGTVVSELAARYGAVPEFQEDRNFYFDWGAEDIFSLAGRGPGECGAGVFDLIEVDLASAHEALEQERLFEATVLASRSLLVTQGQEARSEAEALDLFTRFFLDEGLVGDSFRALIEEARQSAGPVDPGGSFAPDRAEVAAFVETIQKLYDEMDPSLRFRPGAEKPEAAAAAAPPEVTGGSAIDREVDFRGVVCPLNYVKTKMVLGQMRPGSVLSVLLDEEGSRNVPESVRGDGQEVIAVEQDGDHWRVLIRKA